MRSLGNQHFGPGEPSFELGPPQFPFRVASNKRLLVSLVVRGSLRLRRKMCTYAQSSQISTRLKTRAPRF